MLMIQPEAAQRQEWLDFARQEGLGLDILELSLPAALTSEAEQQRALSFYRASGCVLTFHGAFIDVNPGSGDPAFAAASAARFEESCALARQLNVQNIVFHSAAHPYCGGSYIPGWAGRFLDCCAALAEKYSLRICIENSADAYPDALCTLMEKAKGTSVRACLDIGHATISKTPLSEWFTALGDSIAMLHLSDNRGRWDDHLTLGQGAVALDEADAWWRRLGKPGPLVLEVGSLANVRDSLRFLREKHYFDQ